MTVKELILKKIERQGSVRSSDILKETNITRQTLAQHFRELIKQGAILKFGATKNAYYTKPGKNIKREPEFKKTKRLKGLDEDLLFNEVEQSLSLKTRLSDQAYKILRYAFTEMVNNAIEHSQAKSASVWVHLDHDLIGFCVKDRGIGVFENIRQKFKLNDQREAIDLLLKGKQTTSPKGHSGEGIFFTSRISDDFALHSHGLSFEVENHKQHDMFVSELPQREKVKGTSVVFSIKQKTRKNLKELFDQFTVTDATFDKTHIELRLIKKEGAFVSRSEAKRLLYGLDSFRWITIDFKNMTGIGQAFADEVFRVFQNHYPDIRLEAVNMSDTVRFMIERAKNTTLQ